MIAITFDRPCGPWNERYFELRFEFYGGSTDLIEFMANSLSSWKYQQCNGIHTFQQAV